MQNIEEFNNYNFSTALDYMKKYVDITINEAKKEHIYENLDTIYVEEKFISPKFFRDKISYHGLKYINKNNQT
jgi:hypothetical protein